MERGCLLRVHRLQHRPLSRAIRLAGRWQLPLAPHTSAWSLPKVGRPAVLLTAKLEAAGPGGAAATILLNHLVFVSECWRSGGRGCLHRV